MTFSAGGTALCAASLGSGSGSCTASNAPRGHQFGHWTLLGRLGLQPLLFQPRLTVTRCPDATHPATTTRPHTATGWSAPTGVSSLRLLAVLRLDGQPRAPAARRRHLPTADRIGYWLVAPTVASSPTATPVSSAPSPASGCTLPARACPTASMPPSWASCPPIDGGGYFMVASDGGVFAFGDAHFAGSCPGIGGCSGSAVDVMPDASGNGYWIVTETGQRLRLRRRRLLRVRRATGRSPRRCATPDGKGYWVLLSDGAVLPTGVRPTWARPRAATSTRLTPPTPSSPRPTAGATGSLRRAGAVVHLRRCPRRRLHGRHPPERGHHRRERLFWGNSAYLPNRNVRPSWLLSTRPKRTRRSLFATSRAPFDHCSPPSCASVTSPSRHARRDSTSSASWFIGQCPPGEYGHRPLKAVHRRVAASPRDSTHRRTRLG